MRNYRSKGKNWAGPMFITKAAVQIFSYQIMNNFLAFLVRIFI